MNIGTRTVLFGIHQFLIHPYYVWRAWYIVYGERPSFRETICIILHDIGYLGKGDLNGEEGVFHPELGAFIAAQLWPKTNSWETNLILGHSRQYADMKGMKTSKLCLPDKLSILLYPEWLYIFLGRLSGEIAIYKEEMGYNEITDEKWLAAIKVDISIWAQKQSYDDRTILTSAVPIENISCTPEYGVSNK